MAEPEMIDISGKNKTKLTAAETCFRGARLRSEVGGRHVSLMVKG